MEEVVIAPNYMIGNYDFRKNTLLEWWKGVMGRRAEIENRRVFLFKDYLKCVFTIRLMQ